MTKYIGPKTDGENVATQADKLSLSSETPDVLTPDQTGAAGTATTAARSDHQHEILAGAAGTIEPDDTAAEGSSTSFARADHRHAIAAASAGTITGTNAEGTSTSFARADHNHAYGALSIPNSALELGPTYETALPGSPVDGQEIYYAADTTNGIIWHLRYRSAGGTYKWEYVGGGPLRAVDDDYRSITNQTSFTDLPTDPISLSIPLAGEYVIHQLANVVVLAGAARAGYIGVAITNSSNVVQTEATNAKSIYAENPTGDGLIGVSLATQNVTTVATAGFKLRERARTVGNYEVGFQWRRIFVTPIRVG